MTTSLLKITTDAEGIILSRPNRFLAIVDIPKLDLGDVNVHVHDPGRLKELLFPGNKVLLRWAEKEGRKTKWDVIAAWWPGEPDTGSTEPSGQWVLIHSGYHSAIAEAILTDPELSPFGTLVSHRREVKVGKSRMDFQLTTTGTDETSNDPDQIMVEVKGCSLTEDGIALFPDAPTERGRRHLETLIGLRETMRTAVLILILRKDSGCFRPHGEMDPKFAETFYRAMEEGVEMYPALLEYVDGEIVFHRFIPVCE